MCLLCHHVNRICFSMMLHSCAPNNLALSTHCYKDDLLILMMWAGICPVSKYCGFVVVIIKFNCTSYLSYFTYFCLSERVHMVSKMSQMYPIFNSVITLLLHLKIQSNLTCAETISQLKDKSTKTKIVYKKI